MVELGSAIPEGGAASSGFLLISGGSLLALNENVGNSVIGAIQQTGGTNSITDNLVLGYQITGSNYPAGTGSRSRASATRVAAFGRRAAR